MNIGDDWTLDGYDYIDIEASLPPLSNRRQTLTPLVGRHHDEKSQLQKMVAVDPDIITSRFIQ